MKGLSTVYNYDERAKGIAKRLRNVRELKKMTRSDFYEPLGESAEYWGRIERGEQLISLQKVLLVCDTYNIPFESLVDSDYHPLDTSESVKEIHELVEQCSHYQLDIIRKFIEDVVLKL